MRLIWSRKALRDITAIRAFIAQEQPPAADQQVALILRAVAGLTTFPATGRPGRTAGTRELVVGRTPYLVAYRVQGEEVVVLHVTHGRQAWPDDFS